MYDNKLKENKIPSHLINNLKNAILSFQILDILCLIDTVQIMT